jgi:fatty-acid desaturase
MRVIDMWNYLDTTQDPHYLCQKGIAYQSMGDGDEIIYVKTNLQCLGD